MKKFTFREHYLSVKGMFGGGTINASKDISFMMIAYERWSNDRDLMENEEKKLEETK